MMLTNETIRTLTSHSSVRDYTNEPVDEQTVKTLLEVARAASSTCFLQTVTIIRITDKEKKARLAELCGPQPHIARAPEFWVFCADLHRNVSILGKADTGWTEQLVYGCTDAAIAAQVRQLTGNGSRAINDFLMPLYSGSVFSPGSTDVGDVSWLTPTAQIHTATWPAGIPGHSWQVVSCGKSSQARRATHYAAKVLAAAAIELLEEPELLARAQAEFCEKSASGYVCPIEEGAVPIAL